jgi:hypothetical protein
MGKLSFLDAREQLWRGAHDAASDKHGPGLAQQHDNADAGVEP